MASEENTPDVEERSWLGGLISIHSGECSLSASQANVLAHEIFNAPINVVKTPMHPMKELDGVNDYYEVASLGYSLDAVQPNKLALVRQMHIPPKKSGFLARFAQVENIPDDPKLVVQFENGVWVPLAGFTTRDEPGHCRYVQIGAEMIDENYIVTSLDERTNRFKVLDAIIGVMWSFKEDESIDPEEKAVLEQLLRHEFARDVEELDAVFESRLVEDCVAYEVGRYIKQRNIVVLDDSGTHSEAVSVLMQHEETDLGDGRKVEIFLGRDEITKDTSLYAIARDEVALPLAYLQAGADQIEFVGEQPDPIKRRYLVAQITKLLTDYTTEEVKRCRQDTPHQLMYADPNSVVRNETDLKIALYCFRNGLLDLDEIPGRIRVYDDEYDKYELSESKDPLSIYARLDQFFEDMDSYIELPNSPFLKLAAHRQQLLNNLKNNPIDIAGPLNLKKRFDEAIGTFNEDHEYLIWQIQQRCGAIGETKIDRGIIPDVSTDTVEFDAEIEAHCTRISDTQYQLRLYGKSRDMKKEPLQQIHELVFDIAQPNSGIKMDPADIDELSRCLNNLQHNRLPKESATLDIKAQREGAKRARRLRLAEFALSMLSAFDEKTGKKYLTPEVKQRREKLKSELHTIYQSLGSEYALPDSLYQEAERGGTDAASKRARALISLHNEMIETLGRHSKLFFERAEGEEDGEF